MKKIAGSALMMVVLLGAAGLSNAQHKGPKIAATEMRHHAGNVVQGTQVSHIFEIRNTGTETLIIEKVQSG